MSYQALPGFVNDPRSILLLQTSKTYNNALFITSNLKKHNLIQQTALLPN
jgi:hypothetical protein